MDRPWGHMFYIGLYREVRGKIFLSETIRNRALASPGGPLPSLFKVWPCPGGHMFYIGLYREKYENNFLSETTRPRALIFGMKQHLVNLYQVCSNYIPGAKIDPPQGSHVLQRPI